MALNLSKLFGRGREQAPGVTEYGNTDVAGVSNLDSGDHSTASEIIGRPEPNAAQDVFITEAVGGEVGASQVSVGGFGGGVDDYRRGVTEDMAEIVLNARGDSDRFGPGVTQIDKSTPKLAEAVMAGGDGTNERSAGPQSEPSGFETGSGPLQAGAIVILDNDGETEVARVADGILPHIEQDPLFSVTPQGIIVWNGEAVSHGFTGTDEQMSQLVGHLQERGLIDTSTGEIVWADESSASFTGSDEEIGALIAWLQENRLIDTSTGEINWLQQPAVGPDGFMVWNGETVSRGVSVGGVGGGVDDNRVWDDTDIAHLQVGNASTEGQVHDIHMNQGSAQGYALPEVGDEVVVAMRNNEDAELTSQTQFGDADGDGDVDGADFLAWQQNLRSSNPPEGILPYLEQSNLVEGSFSGSDSQLRELVGNLEQRGLIDTSTGEIVWADEASFTGSDEEIGALLAWLQAAQPAAAHGMVWESDLPPASGEGFVSNTPGRFNGSEGNDAGLVSNETVDSHGVVMKDGSDNVTLENYADSPGQGDAVVSEQDVWATDRLRDARPGDGQDAQGFTVEIAGHGLTAAKNEVAIESIEVAHEGLNQQPPGGGSEPGPLGIDVWEHAVTSGDRPGTEQALQDVFVTELRDARPGETGQASYFEDSVRTTREVADEGASTLLQPAPHLGDDGAAAPSAFSLNFEEIKVTLMDPEMSDPSDADADFEVPD